MTKMYSEIQNRFKNVNSSIDEERSKHEEIILRRIKSKNKYNTYIVKKILWVYANRIIF